MRGEKIDCIALKESQGEFVESGRNDILREAFGKDEHPGRLRGMGSRALLTKHFGPSTSKQRGSRGNHDQCKEMLEHMHALVNHLYSKVGVSPPEDLPILKMPFNRTQESNISIPSVQSPLKRPTTDTHKQFVWQKETLSEKVETEDDKFEKDHTSCSPNKVSDPVGDFDDGTKCQLFLEDPRRRIVAYGKIYNITRDHGNALRKDTVKVIIDRVVDGKASLPFPVDGASTLEEADGNFLVWPKKLTRIAIESEEMETISRKVKKTKENADEVGSTKTKESKTALPPTKKDRLHIIDPKSLPPICKQLCTWLECSKKENVITIQMKKQVVGEEYEFYMSKENFMDFFSMDELDISCIQVFLKAIFHLSLSRKHPWIGLLCPAIIQKSWNEENTTVAYIVKTMQHTKKKTFLALFFEGHHWMLCVIRPNENVAYWFDPLWHPPHKYLVSLLEKVTSRYQMSMKIPPEQHKHLEWKEIHYHKQVGYKECGYYIMAYMRDIVYLERNDIDLALHFKEVCDPYTKKDLDVIREQWAVYFMNKELDSIKALF